METVRVFADFLWRGKRDCKEHKNDCFFLPATIVNERISNGERVVDVVFHYFPKAVSYGHFRNGIKR